MFFFDRFDREQPKTIRIKIQGESNEVAELYEGGIFGKPVSPLKDPLILYMKNIL